MPGYELINEHEKNAVAKVFEEGGALMAHGSAKRRKKYHVRDFEKKCELFFGVSHAMALSSGTAALKCALKASGVQPGDEVITQSFNFIATIEAILDCGAKPVCLNINEDLNFDIDELSSKISSRTKCIIVVHMLGLAGPLKQLGSFCKKHNLVLIEDACEAVGGKYQGNYMGAISDIGVFSFDYGKNMTCGEGGMCLTNNSNFANFIRSYSDHGHALDHSVPRGVDKALMPGFNFRMTEMQAAVGAVQLEKLPQLIAMNRERYGCLASKLEGRCRIRMPSFGEEDEGSQDTFILSCLGKSLKNEILEILNNNSFPTKNLPDAIRWHCSYFWDHALNQDQINHCEPTLRRLESSVAIPIFVSRSTEEYNKLGAELSSIVN